MWDPKRLYEERSIPVVRDAPRPAVERPTVRQRSRQGTVISNNPEFLVRQIRVMLESPDHQFGAETLRGILETITRRGVVTERQFVAIQNIQDAGDRKTHGKTSAGRRTQRNH